MIWTSDPDGRYTYVSPAAGQLLGMRPDALHGLAVSHGMTAESGAAVAATLEQARAGTLDEALLQTETILDDGQWLYLETRIVAVRDEHGTLTALAGVSRDITERQRTEDARAYRQEFERLVAEISRMFIETEAANLDAAIEAALKAAGIFAGGLTYNLYLFDAEQEAFVLSHRWIPEGVTPSLQLGACLAFADLPWFLPRLRAGETLYSLAGEPLPPGAEREQALLERVGWDSMVLVPILAAGRLLGYATLSTPERVDSWTTECVELCRFVGELALNAVDHERTQDALRRGESRLATAQAIAHLGSWEWDIAANAVRWSDELFRIFGLSPDEPEPDFETFLTLLHPDDRESVQEAMALALQERKGYVHEARVLRPAGEARWVAVHGEPMFEGEEEPQRMVGTVQDITERRHAESALRESEARYRMLADRASDVIWATDSRGVFTYVSPSVERALGYTPDDLVGEQLARIMDSDTVALASSLISEAVAGDRETARIEAPLVPKSGDGVWCEIEAVAVRDAAGTLIGLQGVTRDTSERKRAEEALRESEERFRTLVEHAPEAIVVLDAETGRFMDANNNALRLFKLDRDGLCRVGPLDLSPPTQPDGRPSSEGVAVHVEAALAGGEPSFQWMHRDAAGHDIPCEVRLIAMSWGGRRVVRGSVLDITERRRAEQERDRLAAAVHQAGEAILITDATGTIEYVNPAFEAITGYTRAEAVDQNPRILKSGVEDPALYADLWTTILRGAIWRARFFNRRKDGTLYETESVITPVRDDTGAVVRFVQVQTDVTERGRLEAQLRQAQKMEAVGTLAGGIAHDFNNLLTGILGGIELACMQLPRDSQAVADLKEAEASAVRAAELTQQLLTVSRRREPTFGSMDVGAALDATVRLVRRSLPETIAVHTQVAPGVPAIRGDTAQLEQALLNLAINARDAMPRGGMLTLDVSTLDIRPEDTLADPRARPGRFVLIEVADTGTGMPPDVLDQVFDPFFTTKEQGKGTGLGLAMVYSCIEAHEGWVAVESTVGKGTTFRLYLPLIPGDAPETGAAEASAVARGVETILLVDDAEGVRQIGRTLLERLGYTVLTATDGEDAVAVFEQHGNEIALVVTDLVMPRAGGRELLHTLRRLGAPVPVVAMSGYASGAGPEELLGEGFSAFVAKPFRIGRLAQTVREVLDRGRPGPGQPT